MSVVPASYGITFVIIYLQGKEGFFKMAEKIIMTKKNYDDLVAELDYLVKVKRAEIVERIVEARGHGDLSENAEYTAAREEQAANESKIEFLNYEIKNAVIQEDITDNSFVHLDSVVTVFDEEFEEEDTYTITSVTNVDVANNKISSESPVGAALMGKKAGDVVTVKVPNGSYQLKILAIN